MRNTKDSSKHPAVYYVHELRKNDCTKKKAMEL